VLNEAMPLLANGDPLT